MFKEYIIMLPNWKKILIQKAFTDYPSSLTIELDAEENYSSSSKELKLMRHQIDWFISTTTGKITTHGGNQIFGN